MRTRSVVGTLLVLAISAPLLRPQERPAAREPAFPAGVALVTVPVYVSDSAGRPVSGLGAADFEVQEDGKAVAVASLHEIDAGRFATQGMAPQAAAAARRQFLLLFDLSFSSPGGLLRAREAATDFVRDDVGPHDLAAVATTSVQNGVKLLVAFTSDRTQLAKAIDTLGVLHLDRTPDPLGLTYEFAEPGTNLASANPLEAASAEDEDARPRSLAMAELQEALRQYLVLYRQAEAASYAQRAGGAMDGLRQLAEALGAVQGRKQILFLSSGFSDRAVVGEQGMSQLAKDAEAISHGSIWEVSSDSRFGDVGIRKQMDQMVQAFSGADCVVHAVDVSGLGGRGDVKEQLASDARPGDGQQALSQIASATGGRFIKNTNDLGEALGEIVESTRRYYVLGFEPGPARGAGAFHRLKVRVKGKGRTVAHRTGYTETPGAARSGLARLLTAGEAIAKEASGGALDVRALAVPYRNELGRVGVPVVLEIDGRSLLDRPADGKLPLEVYGYALSDAWRVEDTITLKTTLDLAAVGDRIRARGVQCHGTFSVPEGTHSLRFLVRDTATGRTGARSLTVSVPRFETGGVVLYPPLLMDDPEAWLMIPTPSRVAREVETPFRVGDDAFTPQARARLRNGQTDRMCLMAFDGGATYPPGSDFEIKTALLDGQGAAVPLGKVGLATSVAETDGFRRFVLSVTPADVAPGPYTLRVRFKEPAAREAREVSIAVAVE